MLSPLKSVLWISGEVGGGVLLIRKKAPPLHSPHISKNEIWGEQIL
jgi:hypothetical protein